MVVAAVGAGGPVEARVIQPLDHGRQQLVIDPPARIPVARLLPVNLIGKPVVLVVAAPQGDAGAVAQSSQDGHRLSLHLGHEIGVVIRIRGTGKHEILPDKDTQFVAEPVENVLLVDAAAPGPQHVHVGRHGQIQELPVSAFIHLAEEGIGRDPVGPFGEDFNPVQHEGEELCPRLVWVRRLVHLNGAHADPLLLRVQKLIPGPQFHN